MCLSTDVIFKHFLNKILNILNISHEVPVNFLMRQKKAKIV